MKLAPVELVVFLIPPDRPRRFPTASGLLFDAPVLLHYTNGPFPGSRTLNLVAVVSLFGTSKNAPSYLGKYAPPKAPPQAILFAERVTEEALAMQRGFFPMTPLVRRACRSYIDV